ncbi:succinate dehydrogenase hydrophobic membrane anchor subunit [Demequina pelophila]|uniref:succinate dehydrogenase hydrophobic membrane anchor subunit n=1 Tax=Demequina pelophila TaxID=1638984 RepID=UPI0007820053|nr:succinate dehydrogenase hydrophobic membrane anchor subunit [Demequina pelophila]
MTAPQLKEPRTPSGRSRNNAEKWSWVFMRVSGPILLVLIVTHLFVNLMTGDGISQIDFAFVAGKLAHPFWQWFDFTMLVLAMLHGFNGMRLLINDYARRPGSRKLLHSLLGTATLVVIVLGTLVLFTFDPCPAGADPDLLPTFCEDVA